MDVGVANAAAWPLLLPTHDVAGQKRPHPEEGPALSAPTTKRPASGQRLGTLAGASRQRLGSLKGPAPIAAKVVSAPLAAPLPLAPGLTTTAGAGPGQLELDHLHLPLQQPAMLPFHDPNLLTGGGLPPDPTGLTHLQLHASWDPLHMPPPQAAVGDLPAFDPDAVAAGATAAGMVPAAWPMAPAVPCGAPGMGMYPWDTPMGTDPLQMSYGLGFGLEGLGLEPGGLPTPPAPGFLPGGVMSLDDGGWLPPPVPTAAAAPLPPPVVGGSVEEVPAGAPAPGSKKRPRRSKKGKQQDKEQEAQEQEQQQQQPEQQGGPCWTAWGPMLPPYEVPQGDAAGAPVLDNPAAVAAAMQLAALQMQQAVWLGGGYLAAAYAGMGDGEDDPAASSGSGSGSGSDGEIQERVRFRGVFRRPGRGVYEGRVRHQGRTYYCGTHRLAAAAARAVDRQSVALHGDKAITNFPLSDYKDLLDPEDPPGWQQGEVELAVQGGQQQHVTQQHQQQQQQQQPVAGAPAARSSLMMSVLRGPPAGPSRQQPQQQGEQQQGAEQQLMLQQHHQDGEGQQQQQQQQQQQGERQGHHPLEDQHTQEQQESRKAAHEQQQQQQQQAGLLEQTGSKGRQQQGASQAGGSSTSLATLDEAAQQSEQHLAAMGLVTLRAAADASSSRGASRRASPQPGRTPAAPPAHLLPKQRVYRGVWQRHTGFWGRSFRGRRDGIYGTAEEAARAYDEEAIRADGVEARTNFPLTDYPELLQELNLSADQAPRKYRGVARVRAVDGRQWRGQVVYMNKEYSCGRWRTPDEAARAVDRQALQLRGLAAQTNFPLSDYEDLLQQLNLSSAPAEQPELQVQLVQVEEPAAEPRPCRGRVRLSESYMRLSMRGGPVPVENKGATKDNTRQQRQARQLCAAAGATTAAGPGSSTGAAVPPAGTSSSTAAAAAAATLAAAVAGGGGQHDAHPSDAAAEGGSSHAAQAGLASCQQPQPPQQQQQGGDGQEARAFTASLPHPQPQQHQQPQLQQNPQQQSSAGWDPRGSCTLQPLPVPCSGPPSCVTTAPGPTADDAAQAMQLLADFSSPSLLLQAPATHVPTAGAAAGSTAAAARQFPGGLLPGNDMLPSLAGLFETEAGAGRGVAADLQGLPGGCGGSAVQCLLQGAVTAGAAFHDMPGLYSSLLSSEEQLQTPGA